MTAKPFRYSHEPAGLAVAPDVVFTRYESVEEITKEMWGDEPIEICGFDGDGKEYHLSIDEYYKNLKTMGCYAFARNKNEIHFWADPKVVQPADLIGMLSHELGHLRRPHHRDEMKEEIKAEKYGDVASLSYTIANQIKLSALTETIRSV